MVRPKICAVITDSDPEAIKKVKKAVDLFELRIDMIGDGWKKQVKLLDRPWIACCRSSREGGRWKRSEQERIRLLVSSAKLGADMVDIELGIHNIEKAVSDIRKHSRCLLSFHDFKKTPSTAELEDIVKNQIAAGADICKVVTTARSVEDNLTVLSLIGKFPNREMLAFAMGPQGALSRVLCPLVGGSFTYASVVTGKESAPGQLNAADLRKIYRKVKLCPA